MRNFKTLIYVVALLSIFSCSDDDDTVIIPNQTATDSWTLVTASGTFAGILHEFPNGTIVWTFNSNNTVTVVNNNTDENKQSGLASGTYPYTIANNTEDAICEKKITINLTADFGCFTQSNTQMDIDQSMTDGIKYHFEKVMPFETN